MKRIICASFPLLLVGCTTLDANSDFSDAIDSIEEKQNYTLVVGKSLTPIANPQRGGQLVKSSLELNYVAPLKGIAAPDSFISMEMTYFKTYDEYKFATVDGDSTKIPLVNYAAPSETCSDICTQTQYFNIPLSNQDIEQATLEDLSFDVAVSDNDKINFVIPAGYIEAIVERGNAYSQASISSIPMVATSTTTPMTITAGVGAASVSAVPVVVAATDAAVVSETVVEESKPQEMTQYWFEQLNDSQKESMTQWAVENRKTASINAVSGSQEEQMFGYWFNKANEQERKNIIIRLLD